MLNRDPDPLLQTLHVLLQLLPGYASHDHLHRIPHLHIPQLAVSLKFAVTRYKSTGTSCKHRLRPFSTYCPPPLRPAA